MSIDRRGFLKRAGASAGGALGAPACRTLGSTTASSGAPPDWAAVRAEFPLTRDRIHLALMLLTSHPRPVREAIERHRRALDENPIEHFEANFFHADDKVRAAAARYMGGKAEQVALTDSTTMSLAVLYGGLVLGDGDEIVTTTHDHYSTDESLRLAIARAGRGTRLHRIALYDQPVAASEDEITRRLVGAITPRTRLVALTWVHSSTGVKLPIARLAEAVATLNAQRPATARIRLCVDGVHGFGVERESPEELGCDFFAAGCHKWIFGPRGTGVLWGRPEAWTGHVGVVPPFEREPYGAWMKGELPKGPAGPMATPGGFHSFEHRWALGEAFAFHERIGRARITERIHALARQCKEGLSRMRGVKVQTPMGPALSAGLVCFEVAGLPAPEVVKRLAAKGILASVTPYATEYARFSPGILNTEAEIETTLREVRALTTG